MRMSLRHIEVFHAIMTSGSVTRAADLLRTSQPTLSRELATLEQLLGFKLFERRSRRLYATEKALLFHMEVRRSYLGLEQLSQVAESIREESNKSLQIGCLPLFSLNLVPRVAQRILALEPAFRLGINPSEHSTLMHDLLALRYELGIVEVGVPVDGMDIEEVICGEEVCVLPAGHRLAEKRVISPSDLDGETIISYPSNDAYRARFQSLFADTLPNRKVRIEVPVADAICALVQQNVGIALVNPFSAYGYRQRGVIARPLSISIPFVVGICRPRGRPLSSLASSAASLIVEECRTMAAEFGQMETWLEP